uniref:Uncharacterized protein n=2 Tax=Branchiostoma floridae TaxID=7739 RepID=C3YBF7_BRAFL|eukprot:XP_002606304.1 hypothetical protein BRAFLDRAFT_67544 [Branchiostoma floridae]
MCQQQQPARTPKCFGNSAVKALSITQVVCGGLAIVLGIVIIVLRDRFSFIGYPIWIGALIITFMVLSIVSAVFTIIMLQYATSAIFVDLYIPCRYCNDKDARLAINALLVILALLEAGLSITSSVMTCCAVCPCCSCDGQGHQSVTMADSEPGSGAAATAPSAAAEGPGEPASKKGRGRPKKSEAQPAAEGRSALRRRPVVAPEHYAPPPPNPSGKRGRGRPRKSEGDEEPPVKKVNSGQGKRGRPPKSVNSEAARPKGRPKGSKKKGKGQPAKAAEKDEEDFDEEEDAEEIEEKTEVVETPKKRGRPKKDTPAVVSESDNKVDADAPAEKTDDSAEEGQ